MADLLRFKKGLASGLTDLAKSAGTIYVTTDEHAMYVDIDNSTRIRLGDFIVASSLADLATEAYKPYSTTALYYITAENALARYDGSKWVQINDTADLESAITVLEGYVGKPATATTDGKATGLFKDIVDLNAKIEAITGEEGDEATSIAGLSARLVTAEGDIDDLEGVVGDANSGLVKRMTDAEADIDDLEAASTLYNQKLATLEGENNVVGSVKHTVKTAVDELANGAVATNTATLNTLTDNGTNVKSVATQISEAVAPLAVASEVETTTDGLDSRITANEEYIAGLKKDSTHAGSIANITTRLETVEEQSETNEAAITKLNGASTVEGSVDYKVKQLETSVANTYETKTTVSGIDSRLTAAEEAIAGFKTGEGSVDTKINTAISSLQGGTTSTVKAVEDKADAAQTAVNTLAGKVGTVPEGSTVIGITDALDNRLDTAESNITKNAEDIAGLKTADSNLSKKIDDDIAAAKTALSSEIDSDVAAAKKDIEDAYKAADTTINGRIDTANSNITALQEKDVELAEDIKANTDAIAVLNGDSATVGSVEYKIAQKLQVADAMTFGGVVKAYSELPATPTKGETYKVGVAGTYGDYVCEVGDLLIANGKETNGVILAADLTWEHVPAGGQDDTDPTMSVADNTISLNNHVGVSLGTATITGSDAVEVTTSGNTISIDLVWGSF